MADKVRIFDTTLRDGEQSPGASMNRDEKLQLGRKLAALNVDIIEAGFPAASPDDFEAVRQIASEVKGPTICGLARCNKADIKRAWDAVKESAKPRIHTFIATSDIHLEYKLQKSREEVIASITENVGYAASLCPDVQWSAEDASRSDPEFLAATTAAAIAAGARTINIPDTVGYAMPNDFYNLIKYLIENVKDSDKAIFSVHCHNDLGLGVANSLAGLQAGARQAEVCINGIGERAGNAALEELTMAISTRGKYLGLATDIKRDEIYPTSRLVSLITGIMIQPNKAIVGANAFAHESGIHVDGVLKNPLTYEIMTPEEVGLSQNNLVLGKHSGRAGFKARLEEMGYEIDGDDFQTLFKEFKLLAERKKEIVSEDLEVLIAEVIYRTGHRWSLDYMHVIGGEIPVRSASVRMLDDEKMIEEHASGTGPVDAIFNAINKITGTNAQLMRYGIASVTKGLDAQGEVTVRLKENGHVVLGTGSDPDILVASAKAYINGLNRLEQLKSGGERLAAQERVL